MTIANASILVDGTVAVTAGTATTLLSQGDTLGSHNLVLDDGSTFFGQTSLEFVAKNPQISASAPNGYTQKRNTVKLKQKFALDNGNYTVNTGEVKLAVDPETTDAEIQTLKVTLCQLIMDSDFDEFWSSTNSTA